MPSDDTRTAPDGPEGAGAAWFDRLVAGTELALRKRNAGVENGGPIEPYPVSSRLAAKLKTIQCPHCAAVMELSSTLADGQIVVCPVCYGCYEITIAGAP